MKTALAAIFLCAATALADGPKSPSVILLWPKGDAPGESGNVGGEHDTTKADGELVAGHRVIRLGNVSQPTITLYAPEKNTVAGTAVVVCPGGGYNILAMDLEGTEICAWLNSMGVTGILLKYRVPNRPGDDNHLLPLQDAQRALSLVRLHAGEWHLNPRHIGILGFSAGGHLAAHLSNNFERRAYEPVDAADRVSCRPDFLMLIYPAYLAAKNQVNQLAPELKVTTNTPPAFLIQAGDDFVGVENSLTYYRALKDVGISAEMHLYPDGGHGYGLRPSGKPVTDWPKRAAEWLRASGYFENRNP